MPLARPQCASAQHLLGLGSIEEHMNFDRAHALLKGVPHIGEEQARELYRFVLRQQPKRRQGIYVQSQFRSPA